MNRTSKKFKTGCLAVLLIYIFVAALFWVIAEDQLRYQINTTSMLSPLQSVGEITDGVVIEQDFLVTDDEVISVSLHFATFARDYNEGTLTIELLGNGNLYGSVDCDVSKLTDNTLTEIVFDSPVPDVQGQNLTLRLTSDCELGYGVTVMYGNTVNTARGSVEASLSKTQYVRVNGETVEGQLCAQLTTKSALWYGPYYGWFAGAIGALLAAYLVYMLHCEKIGHISAGHILLNVISKYGFLIQQLVARDFKNKYKRSILGMLWSFLNPLMTTLVQYFVFSNIFKSNTENFVVYLLTGTVFFNFFSEASNMAMSSIVTNSSLITKVYVPKYIYPLSRVISSGINFAISLLPLVLVILSTGVEITPAMLLVIYPIICNVILALGMGLLLSSVMVFFRDTQFLYGILLTILMYLTPIFYPITIIPERYQWLFLFNPVSNNIVFARSCILDGVFPGMGMALLCGGYALTILAFGALVFKKTQDQFILHI